MHRFVTSNYDCELEAALVKKRRLREEDYLKHSGKQSFAQIAKYDEQLAIFSIAFAAGYEPRVFHCHGWHCDTDSMVLTEDDYQEWYFRDQAIHRRYRQTIDLIFNSNPMLFVGFSLSDDDLLTPLRFLSALDGEKKDSRPLFALLERSEDNNESRFEQLYDRYGIHVLSYDSKDETESGRTNALCREIGKIVDRCRTHRKEWLERPRKRSIELAPSKGCYDAPAFLHYDFSDSEEPPPADEKQDSCWLTLGRTTPLVWIVGSGGMGMSWEAIQQLKKLRTSKTEPGFSGFFFWNFRYCNDAISGIQCALRFMREPTRPSLPLISSMNLWISCARGAILLSWMVSSVSSIVTSIKELSSL